MIGDTQYYVTGVGQRKAELADSSWLASFWGLLDPFMSPEITEIRCLALGLVCDHLNPRFQLALLLLMAERYHISKVTAWDPAFTSQDREVLEKLGVIVAETDPVPGPHILWYIPHGPLKLIAAMPAVLSTGVYLGNDLSMFELDGEDAAALAEYRTAAEVKRIPVGRNDRWSNAFNAMAIHSL